MKIHIIGGPGSGKTCLAQSLSKRYNVSRFDLDNIFWDRNAARYGTKASPEKRNAGLQKILNKESLADLWRLIEWNHGYDKNNLKPALDFISDYHNKIIFPITEDQVIEEIKFRNIGKSKPVIPNILKSFT